MPCNCGLGDAIADLVAGRRAMVDLEGWLCCVFCAQCVVWVVCVFWAFGGGGGGCHQCERERRGEGKTRRGGGVYL